MRTREGNGEVRFLSGIQDGVRFDTMEGDAALERLLTASDPEFEAVSSLPPIAGSTEPVPPEGGLHRFHAAQLMRYCESNSLTCALELEVEGRVLTARYRLGELLSIEPDSEHTSRLAEAKEGLYRFRLPRFELPANVQQRRSVPAAAAPKPAPAPAPVAAAKPAAKPSPAPIKSPPSSLAETPLVAMKPVAIVTPPASSAAKVPVKAPAAPAAAAPKASPSSSAGPARGAEPRPAPAAARSTASSAPPAAARPVRADEPRAVPPAAAQQPRPAEARASTTAPTSAPPPVAARPAVPRSPLPPAQPAARQAPPSPVPSSAPSSTDKPALEGLWKDAVKPPPQSAPIELDGTLRPKPSPVAAHKPTGRAEGLSSIAYTPTDVPAVPTQRPRSAALYWLLAMLVLIALAVAGWFVFGR